MANIEKRRAEGEVARQQRKAKLAQYRKLAKEFLEEDEVPTPTPPPEIPALAAPNIDYDLLATRLADTLESRMPVVVETPPPPVEKPKRKRAPPRPRPPPPTPAIAPPPQAPPMIRYAPRLNFF
jgi:hypothetical protein